MSGAFDYMQSSTWGIKDYILIHEFSFVQFLEVKSNQTWA